jgi:hypothetical protein
MRKDVVARLNEVVRSLEGSVEVTDACGCEVVTKLLRMARLNLLCEIHGIADAELQAFADELGRKQPTRKASVVYLAERKRIRNSSG